MDRERGGESCVVYKKAHQRVFHCEVFCGVRTLRACKPYFIPAREIRLFLHDSRLPAQKDL